jgi:ATP-dependent DNA helicase RecG
MFENSVKESKLPPDFSGTDDYQVSLVLHGEIQDPLFLRFLEQIGKETLSSFNTTDLIVLDLVHREKPIPHWARDRLPLLRRSGVIEKTGRKYILSRRFYKFVGRKGVYTRKRGLDRETNKALLLRHIQDNKEDGSRFREFKDVLPDLTRDQIQTLLREMKKAGLVYSIGRAHSARWFPDMKKGATK